MRILYVTTIGSTMSFFKSLIKELIDAGHVIDIATNENEKGVPNCYREWGCKAYPISTSRSPFAIGNIKAICELRKIAMNYDIVHCHTPLASMATRLACVPLRKRGLKVIYTAHGFHFYKGAPIKNWLIYYPIEWLCSFFTDVLITITKEDYALAKKRMHAKRIEYVPGVGIDIDRFRSTVIEKYKKREQLAIPKDAFIILSVGELNENKNHKIVVEAISKLDNKSIHYCIAGSGNQYDALIQLAKQLNVSDQVHLLGYRNDVNELYKAADLYVLPSKREGLNVSMMEAMASGLPIICTKGRGNDDFIENGVFGFDKSDLDSLINAIASFFFDERERKNSIERNIIESQKYSSEIINRKLLKIMAEVND